MCIRSVVLLISCVGLFVGVSLASSSVDELPDITGGVVPILTYDPGQGSDSGGELFRALGAEVEALHCAPKPASFLRWSTARAAATS